jgi:myo-inositol-1(or 4)-monophosphatase
VGAVGVGVRRNGAPARTTECSGLAGARVLASRSECGRGEWKRFEGAAFAVRPMGSVAYKLGLVAAGLADATWTLVPKHEWDVAAGVALVRAAGGAAAEWPVDRGGFNRRDPLLTGFVATAPGLAEPVRALLAPLAPAGR